jgi:hypothetical protein
VRIWGGVGEDGRPGVAAAQGSLEEEAMARSWSVPPFRLDEDTGSLWCGDALMPLWRRWGS